MSDARAEIEQTLKQVAMANEVEAFLDDLELRLLLRKEQR